MIKQRLDHSDDMNTPRIVVVSMWVSHSLASLTRRREARTSWVVYSDHKHILHFETKRVEEHLIVQIPLCQHHIYGVVDNVDLAVKRIPNKLPGNYSHTRPIQAFIPNR